VPVSGKEEITGFVNLFMAKARKDITNGHLWLSIFFRSRRSRFTRCQRLTVCLSLLLMTLALNIMFYNLSNSKDDPADVLVVSFFTADLRADNLSVFFLHTAIKICALQFGHLTVSVGILLKGILSSLIAFPLHLLILFIFRNAKERPVSMAKYKTDAVLNSSVPGGTAVTVGQGDAQPPQGKGECSCARWRF